MSTFVKRGAEDCLLYVACENCKKEYQWSSHISESPTEITYKGKTLDTRTTFTVKCPQCGTPEASWMP